jgi:hypothetical protein
MPHGRRQVDLCHKLLLLIYIKIGTLPLQQLLSTDFESENWLTVYHCSRDVREDLAFFSALVPDEMVSTVLQEYSWEISIGDGSPDVGILYKDGKPMRECHSYTERGQIQPIVLVRSFHDIRPSYIEIQEEFRLFHNLYYDATNGKYIKIHPDGREEDIIVVEGESVKIRTRALREYAAIKDLSIVLYFDSVRYSPIPIEQISESQRHRKDRNDRISYSVIIDNNASTALKKKTFSLFIGKRVIEALSKDKYSIWPYDDEPEQYESFIIGLDECGDPIAYSCDPKNLEDPDKDRDVPSYLTPTFFRKEVLNKYYAQPQKYKVGDGHLWCGSLWALRMDNNHPEFVVVWLGDLGKDLPYNEQTYWRTFNIQPEGGVSKTCFRRHLKGEFAEPESPDLLFKHELSQFKEIWENKYGWPLLLELDKKDQHLLTALHIPTTENQAEFDSQILALTKILVDSLNEAELEKRISSSSEDMKGIDKLETFLKVSNIPEISLVVSFFRNLQALRSTGSGHRKGKRYEKVAQRFGIGSKSLQQVFSEILTQAILVLAALSHS